MINEVELKGIGEISKECGIELPRLRDWCNRGLVEFQMKSNTRYIPVSEIKKIEKIRDIFDDSKKRGVRKTFDEIREELEKENLFLIHKENKETEKIEMGLTDAFAKVLQETGMAEVFLTIGEQNQIMKKHLLEQAEVMKKQNDMVLSIQKQNEEMFKMMKEMKLENEDLFHKLETQIQENKELKKTEEEPKSKGFWKGIFGVKE